MRNRVAELRARGRAVGHHPPTSGGVNLTPDGIDGADHGVGDKNALSRKAAAAAVKRWAATAPEGQLPPVLGSVDDESWAPTATNATWRRLPPWLSNSSWPVVELRAALCSPGVQLLDSPRFARTSVNLGGVCGKVSLKHAKASLFRWGLPPVDPTCCMLGGEAGSCLGTWNATPCKVAPAFHAFDTGGPLWHSNVKQTLFAHFDPSDGRSLWSHKSQPRILAHNECWLHASATPREVNHTSWIKRHANGERKMLIVGDSQARQLLGAHAALLVTVGGADPAKLQYHGGNTKDLIIVERVTFAIPDSTKVGRVAMLNCVLCTADDLNALTPQDFSAHDEIDVVIHQGMWHMEMSIQPLDAAIIAAELMRAIVTRFPKAVVAQVLLPAIHHSHPVALKQCASFERQLAVRASQVCALRLAKESLDKDFEANKEVPSATGVVNSADYFDMAATPEAHYYSDGVHFDAVVGVSNLLRIFGTLKKNGAWKNSKVRATAVEKVVGSLVAEADGDATTAPPPTKEKDVAAPPADDASAVDGADAHLVVYPQFAPSIGGAKCDRCWLTVPKAGKGGSAWHKELPYHCRALHARIAGSCFDPYAFGKVPLVRSFHGDMIKLPGLSSDYKRSEADRCVHDALHDRHLDNAATFDWT